MGSMFHVHTTVIGNMMKCFEHNNVCVCVLILRVTGYGTSPEAAQHQHIATTSSHSAAGGWLLVAVAG